MLNYLIAAVVLIIFARSAYAMAGRWHRRGRPPMSPRNRVIALLVFVGGMYLLVTSTMDFSARKLDIYAESLQRASTSSVFADAIGEPYEVSWPIRLNAEETNTDGKAAFDAKVNGPHGKGHLIAVGKKVNGVWHLIQLDIVPSSSGQYISLLPRQVVPAAH